VLPAGKGAGGRGDGGGRGGTRGAAPGAAPQRTVLLARGGRRRPRAARPIRTWPSPHAPSAPSHRPAPSASSAATTAAAVARCQTAAGGWQTDTPLSLWSFMV
jgi:hypothetical protein